SQMATATPTPTPTPTPTATATPEPSISSDASPTPMVSPGASPTASPSTLSSLYAGAMRFQLVASGGQCWISLKADGGDTEHILLNDGQNREFMANEKVIFNSLGNYTAVRIMVNGRQINFAKLLPKQKGVVARNVVITKDNYEQFLD